MVVHRFLGLPGDQGDLAGGYSRSARARLRSPPPTATIEILHAGRRVASHARSYGPEGPIRLYSHARRPGRVGEARVEILRPQRLDLGQIRGSQAEVSLVVSVVEQPCMAAARGPHEAREPASRSGTVPL